MLFRSVDHPCDRLHQHQQVDIPAGRCDLLPHRLRAWHRCVVRGVLMDDFEQLPKMAGWHDNLAVKGEVAYITAAKIKPNYKFIFHGTDSMGWASGPAIGSLDFNGPEMKFEGNADESAKVFFDFIAKSFKTRLEEERMAEREACAKVCEELRYDGYEMVPYDRVLASRIRARSNHG